MVKKTQEFRNHLAEKFLHVLEEKQLDWKMEWGGNGNQIPVNAKSGSHYHGLNRFYLTMIAGERGYQDPRWATFTQIREKGWHLENAKKQGVTVEYWFPFDLKLKKAITWQEFQKAGGQMDDRYTLRAVYSTVFNASLIRGIPELPKPEVNDIIPAELVGKISKNMKVEILHDGGTRAFYRPVEDKIHLPLPEAFLSEYAYDSTAFHELAHATGAAHRLNRDLSGGFGTKDYAYEELIAEISSCFLSEKLPIEQTQTHIENHKAYVQSWVQSIREQPEILVKAIQQAEKVAAYMEYKAELIEKKDYLMYEDTTMELPSESLNQNKIVNPQEEKERNEKMGIGIQENTIRQDVEQIQQMQEEIRDNTEYMKNFMEMYKIPMVQAEQTPKQDIKQKEQHVPNFGTAKKAQKELAPKL